MTTIFDPRTLITRKQVDHSLSDLDGMAIDMAEQLKKRGGSSFESV
jgi:hypothetical protein